MDSVKDNIKQAVLLLASKVLGRPVKGLYVWYDQKKGFWVHENRVGAGFVVEVRDPVYRYRYTVQHSDGTTNSVALAEIILP